ncbi:MAG TPA: hypothetical protein ENN21_02535 [Spirochaetes bacterium]|nr:hypothetical protein [Spirochaetota bacterium]
MKKANLVKGMIQDIFFFDRAPLKEVSFGFRLLLHTLKERGSMRLLIVICLLLTVSFPANADIEARIARVVDGDTIHAITKDGERIKVRFVGIDTPEHRYRRHWQEPWATMATKHLGRLLPPGSEVLIKTASPPLDHYGRVLGMVFNRGVNINLAMVEDGYAFPYLVHPVMDMEEEFSAAFVRARGAGKGIHNPANPLKEPPGIFRLRVSGRAPYWWVGNLKTRRYLPPEGIEVYPVEYRVFFENESRARIAGYRKDDKNS